MHGPPNGQTGRGMLLFAVIVTLLAVWMSIAGDWAGAILWYALAVFFACFGALMSNISERWNRPALVVGLAAGVIAFIAALRLAGARLPW